MPGQLVTYVPAPAHQEALQRSGPRRIDAIFMGFHESHGLIDNSCSMLVPLEALLTGSGSVRPLRTKDYRIPTKRTFPMARLREWNLMFRGARLVANCSKLEYENEVNKLTDPTTNYSPTIILEEPVGVSNKMAFKHSGPWASDPIDIIEFSNPLADQLPDGGPQTQQLMVK